MNLNDKLKNFLNDPLGYIFMVIDGFVLLISKTVFTFWIYIELKLRNIKQGENNIFYGNLYFRRYPQSIIKIGNNCRFRSTFVSNKVGLNRRCFLSTLKKGAKLIIGNNVGLSGTVIGCAECITIGNNVLLGGNTFITDTDWHPLNRNKNAVTNTKPVIIEDDVFIGLNTIVLKGSKIGKGSVIGANSVVAGEIPPNVIAAGNPCKVVKELN